jgi:transposase
VENKRVLVLTQLWVAGETCEAIGKRLGVSSSTVHVWAKRYKLPKRRKPMKHREIDPTPEHIEAMKAELKRRHIEARIAEGVCRPKVSRA